MATQLHRVWLNAVWRIGQIEPANTRGTLARRFTHLDGASPSQASGTGRGYEVARISRTPSLEPTDMHARTAWHVFSVEVYYPREMRPSALYEVSSQDAHDIIMTLRAESSWVGYDDDHTTDDIGILARIEDGDEIVSTAGNHVMRQRWRVLIREVEYA